MAEVANTVTSSSGTESAVTSDTVFKVLYTCKNFKDGVYVYFNYDENGAGTVAVTFDTIQPLISSTNLYRIQKVLDSDGTVTSVTLAFTAADQLKRVFVPLVQGETTLQVNVTIQTTTQSGIMNVEFVSA